MKQLSVFLIFSLSTTILCYGQSSMYSYKEVYWYPSNFKKHGVTKTKEYSYELKRNGKVKDSTLMCTQEYDSLRNRVFGMEYYQIFGSHTPSKTEFYNYERIYNQDEKLTKETHESISPKNKKSYGSIDSEYNNREILSEYNKKGDIIKEISNEISISYSVDKKTKDTLSYHKYIKPKIMELIYKEDKLILQYNTVDSTKHISKHNFFNTKETIEDTTYCYYCHPRHKSQEKHYSKNGLLKQYISYTYDNEIHTKIYFYYDEKQRITKEVDSTGWFHTTIKPYLESITTYEYNESGKTVTKVRIANEFSSSTSTIEKYDLKNRVIESCYISEDYKSCISYIYENDKLKTVINSDKESEYFIHFLYNEQGLLIEEKKIHNNKTKSLTRYYYE